MEGGAAAKRQLEFIDQQRSRIITSSQVQMEFLKNRQDVLIGTLAQIKKPEGNIIQIPPVLTDSQPSKQVKQHVDKIKKQQSKLRDRMERILTNPASHDNVYQCVQRLFRVKNEFNLSRTHKDRFRIRRLARKRHLLGYPPRKSSDTSIGDAIHWEWIIDCAAHDKSNVLIVSRDGDFGSSHGGHDHINDWLLKEFRERVGRNLRVELSKRLTEAMVRFDVEVSTEDKEEESKFVGTWRDADILRFALTRGGLFSPSSRIFHEMETGDFVGSHFERAIQAVERNNLSNLADPFGLSNLVERFGKSAVEKAMENFNRPNDLLRSIQLRNLTAHGLMNPDEEADEKPKKTKEGRKKKKGKKKD